MGSTDQNMIFQLLRVGKKFINELKSNNNYTVFINNAYNGFAQVRLLNDVYSIWKDKPDKYIININRRAKYPNISKGYM